MKDNMAVCRINDEGELMVAHKSLKVRCFLRRFTVTGDMRDWGKVRGKIARME